MGLSGAWAVAAVRGSLGIGWSLQDLVALKCIGAYHKDRTEEIFHNNPQ